MEDMIQRMKLNLQFDFNEVIKDLTSKEVETYTLTQTLKKVTSVLQNNEDVITLEFLTKQNVQSFHYHINILLTVLIEYLTSINQAIAIQCCAIIEVICTKKYASSIQIANAVTKMLKQLMVLQQSQERFDKKQIISVVHNTLLQIILEISSAQALKNVINFTKRTLITTQLQIRCAQYVLYALNKWHNQVFAKEYNYWAETLEEYILNFQKGVIEFKNQHLLVQNLIRTYSEKFPSRKAAILNKAGFCYHTKNAHCGQEQEARPKSAFLKKQNESFTVMPKKVYIKSQATQAENQGLNVSSDQLIKSTKSYSQRNATSQDKNSYQLIQFKQVEIEKKRNLKTKPVAQNINKSFSAIPSQNYQVEKQQVSFALKNSPKENSQFDSQFFSLYELHNSSQLSAQNSKQFRGKKMLQLQNKIDKSLKTITPQQSLFQNQLNYDQLSKEQNWNNDMHMVYEGKLKI